MGILLKAPPSDSEEFHKYKSYDKKGRLEEPIKDTLLKVQKKLISNFKKALRTSVSTFKKIFDIYIRQNSLYFCYLTVFSSYIEAFI